MHQHLELATGRVLRPSLPDDAPRLVAMFERCSPASRYGRFLAPVRHFPAAHLVDVVRPSRIRAVVGGSTTATPGSSSAVGSWFRNQLFTAEVGLLVEDAAERQGLGTELLDTIADDRPHRRHHHAGGDRARGVPPRAPHARTARSDDDRLRRTHLRPDVDLSTD